MIMLMDAMPGSVGKIVLAGTLSLGLTSCGIACDNLLLSQQLSPTGEYTALHFTRSCGATTEISNQISVIRSGERPSATGNVLIAVFERSDGDVRNYGIKLMKWTGDRELSINYNGESDIFIKESHIDGVAIKYNTPNIT